MPWVNILAHPIFVFLVSSLCPFVSAHYYPPRDCLLSLSVRAVFNDLWAVSLSGTMHELGHTLSLLHSGEGDSKYGDQTGYMVSGFDEIEHCGAVSSAHVSADINPHCIRATDPLVTCRPKSALMGTRAGKWAGMHHDKRRSTH